MHAIGNGVAASSQARRSSRSHLRADEAACEATVEECLRYDAPLHLFTRYASRGCRDLAASACSRGDRIGLLLGAANRDPARFHRPHGFDRTRESAAAY